MEPRLNELFANSILRDFDVKIRYIPIVMPINLHEVYPERSKLNVKSRIIDCAPHLRYETFVAGSRDEQMREYLSGILLSSRFLEELGMDKAQMKIFEEIVHAANDALH